MEHLVKARVLVAELAQEELIEVRRPDAVGRDLAALVQQLGRPPSGFELEQWLEQHRLVSEIYVSADALDQALHRHFGEAFSHPAVVQDACNPDLERLIRESPAVEHCLVYSDWLQERADPLGELIALGVAADSGGPSDVARFERHLKLHEDHLLGAAAKQIPERVALSWRCGLVHTVDALAQLDAQSWEELLRLRVCQFVRVIKLALDWSYDEASSNHVLHAIDACASESLRELHFEGCRELAIPTALLRRALQAITIHGGRATIGGELPGSLERLRLRVREIACLNAPRGWEIRQLDVNLSRHAADLFARVELERLERLTLQIRGCPADQLLAFLRAIKAPVLVHLELCGGRVAARFLGTLARLPLARGLTSLALTRLALTDQAMQALARERPRFESLASLDLSNNELSREGLEAARALAPQVVSRRQERPGTSAHNRLRRFAGSRLLVAEKIADPKLWRDSGVDGDVLWGRYRGTEDYELFVKRDLGGYGCSCPSSIQPCKHVVALALVAERTDLVERPSGGIEHRVRRGAVSVAQVAEDDAW